ncbi:MAG: hypothetical protein GY951_18520 [Psychromonas sp.]|nr:hypothetical protein [Alteromonadales bacterium]MCP5080026.1 hypothetical protein [Psychromonas sp.]
MKTTLMHPLLSFVFLLLTCANSQAVTPSFHVNKAINFGLVLFITGNCTMDHNTGVITDSNPSKMCGSNGNGTRGYYTIIANPNKQISFKIDQRNNEGDGFLYIPAGELSSDFETVAITPNIAQQINSGSSGVVNIYLGGQFFIVSPASPSTPFTLTKIDGIEWSELP